MNADDARRSSISFAVNPSLQTKMTYTYCIEILSTYSGANFVNQYKISCLYLQAEPTLIHVRLDYTLIFKS